MVGVLADDIHHVVDGDPAQQSTLLVHYRRRYPVLALKQPGDFGVRHVHRDGFDVRRHHFAHCSRGIGYQQGAQRQQADKLVGAVHHDQVIGHLRNFFVAAQVAQHDIQGERRADRDGIRVHQAARGVLRVEHHPLQARPVLVVHGGEDFSGNAVGQLLENIGDVVVLQAFHQ